MDCYGEVLCAAAEYPVQVDAMETHMRQQHLQALRKMLKNVLLKRDLQTILQKRCTRHAVGETAFPALCLST